MSGLSRESKALLDAARDGDNPSGDDRRRVRAALARKIAVGAAAGAVAVTATHAATGGVAAAGSGGAVAGGAVAGGAAAGGAVAGGVAVGAVATHAAATGVVATGLGAKILVSVAIVGALGAGTVTYTQHQATKRAEATATYVATPAASAVAPKAKAAAPVFAAAPQAPSAPDLPVALDPPAPEAKPVAAAPLAPAPAASPAAGAPDIDAELALLQDVHAALRANEGARALRLLDERARRFPNGALGEEGAAARVFALCALGRADEARDVAGRFLREHPRSPLAPRVARVCDAEP